MQRTLNQGHSMRKKSTQWKCSSCYWQWSVNLSWCRNRGHLATCLFLDQKWSESPKIMFLSQFWHAFLIGNHLLYIFHVENGKIQQNSKKLIISKSTYPQNAIKTMVVKALPQIVHFMNRYHMRTSQYILIMKNHT